MLANGWKPHDWVAERMVEALDEHNLFASTPSLAGKWLSAPLRSAGISRHALRAGDIDDALRKTATEILLAVFGGVQLGREEHNL